jgi:hypothetical protein
MAGDFSMPRRSTLVARRGVKRLGVAGDMSELKRSMLSRSRTKEELSCREHG